MLNASLPITCKNLYVKFYDNYYVQVTKTCMYETQNPPFKKE